MKPRFVLDELVRAAMFVEMYIDELIFCDLEYSTFSLKV